MPTTIPTELTEKTVTEATATTEATMANYDGCLVCAQANEFAKGKGRTPWTLLSAPCSPSAPCNNLEKVSNLLAKLKQVKLGEMAHTKLKSVAKTLNLLQNGKTAELRENIEGRMGKLESMVCACF